MSPLVDVNIAVYNQVSYLRQTLDSVLAQQTNFPFRLLIGDDCSTDGSVDILKEYEKKYPDTIKIIYQPKNLGFHSEERNGLVILKNSTAKYIALLDGDDYWTDPLKLQKQVDFLEQNPEYVLCSANASIENLTANPFRKIYSHFDKDMSFNQAQVLTDFYCPTLTILFRNKILVFPDWFREAKSGDSFIYYLLSKYGKFYFMNSIVGIYRQHNSGISNTNNKVKWFENDLQYLNELRDYVEPGSLPSLKELFFKIQLEYIEALKKNNQKKKALGCFFKMEPLSLPLRKKYFKQTTVSFLKTLLSL